MSRKQVKTEDFVKIVRGFYKKNTPGVRSGRDFCVRNTENWLNSVYRQAQTACNGARDRQEKLQAGTVQGQGDDRTDAQRAA